MEIQYDSNRKFTKKYRLDQGKTQAKFVGHIISRSFYSKIEKNMYQISVNDLMNLLNYNDIDLIDFLIKLNHKHLLSKNIIFQQRKLMELAYYNADVNQMLKIKKIIDKSTLPEKNKQQQILILEAFIELTKIDGKPNIALRKKLKTKVFSIPNFNQTKFMLYCNSMRFYSLADNKVIAKKLIIKYKNSKELNIQKNLLSIVINILIFSIEQNQWNNINFFITFATQIPTIPDLFFYKNVITFFIYLIKYIKEKNSQFLKKCDLIIENIKFSGMSNYAVELNKFNNKYH